MTKIAPTSAAKSILFEDRSGRSYCVTGRDDSSANVTNPSPTARARI
jgi:hypothetical protein